MVLLLVDEVSEPILLPKLAFDGLLNVGFGGIGIEGKVDVVERFGCASFARAGDV